MGRDRLLFPRDPIPLPGPAAPRPRGNHYSQTHRQAYTSRILAHCALHSQPHSLGKDVPLPSLAAFSRSLSLLHKEYEPRYFFWEIMELTRKLILVGVASLELVRPGSVTQLYMALIASVFFLVLQVTHVSSPPHVLCLPHPRCWH